MKRPNQEDFKKIYDEHGGNITAIAEACEVSTRTVYNWKAIYIEELQNNIEKKEEELSFDDYVNIHVDNIIKPVDRDIACSLNRSCLVVCMSDTHLGSVYADVNRLQADKNIIKETDGVYALFCGDIIDWTPTGPKSLIHDQILSPKHAKDWAAKFIKELSHKMIAIVSGCHDDWEYNATGEYFGDQLAEYTVTKAFVPDSMSLSLKVGNIPYKIYMSHKPLSKSTMNPSHAIFRAAREKQDFDIGVVAHYHTPGIAVQNIREKSVIAVNCGGYKKLDTFAGKMGLTQQPLSIPGFYLDHEKRRIVPFFDWREGLIYLKGRGENN